MRFSHESTRISTNERRYEFVAIGVHLWALIGSMQKAPSNSPPLRHRKTTQEKEGLRRWFWKSGRRLESRFPGWPICSFSCVTFRVASLLIPVSLKIPLTPGLRHVAIALSTDRQRSAMRDDYIKEAQKLISDPNVLINVVSRRVKQLRRGSRPLVESLEKLAPEDIALREVIEGKISHELAEV